MSEDELAFIARLEDQLHKAKLYDEYNPALRYL